MHPLIGARVKINPEALSPEDRKAEIKGTIVEILNNEDSINFLVLTDNNTFETWETIICQLTAEGQSWFTGKVTR
jgi:hypothetical protein